MTVVTKRCRACDRRRALSAFPPRRARRDGLDSYCRDCRRAYWRRWLAKNRAAYNAALRAYRAEHTDAIRAYNRARSEARRAYQREYAWRRRAMIRAGRWNPRTTSALPLHVAEHVRLDYDSGEKQFLWRRDSRDGAMQAGRVLVVWTRKE
jgi:hypothetical protein